MKCSFCKRNIEEGRGSLIAKKDGKVNRFCSNKCRKNFLKGRSAQKLKWITKEKKK